MNPDANNILRELEAVAAEPDFDSTSIEIVDKWLARGVGVEAVDPILRFMESHSDIEYGLPGALVHFVERFHEREYERLLLESMLRQPTWTTTWMLNRLINGTRDQASRSHYIRAMKQVLIHPEADSQTLEQARHFLMKAGS